MPILSCLSVLLLVLLMVATVQGEEAFVAQTHTGKDGQTLPYRLLSPEKIEPGKRYPLVIFLHGAGERGKRRPPQHDSRQHSP